MNYARIIRTFIAPTLLLTLSLSARAGGPISLCEPNVPFLWPDGGTNIPFNPDQGDLGVLSNEEATAAVADSFQVFEDVSTSTVTYVNAGEIPVDVDETNFFAVFFPGIADGLSPIVFDDDGAIFDLLFGPDSGVLGFAGQDVLDPDTCGIVEGAAFLNGPAIDTLEGLVNVMVHEFGHYTNLAHTVVNGQIFIGDTTGPTPDNETFGEPPNPAEEDIIETMYPFLFGAFDQNSRTLHKDDIAILSTLYPEPDFLADTATINGTISVLERELSGVNVIARNVDNPYEDAASAISGDFTQGAPETGVYTINNLTPGANYAVYVDFILAGSFSTPPRIVPPGPEEFHNASGTESGDDDPLVFDPVLVAAGAPSTGIDVIFNDFQADTPLPVGDDGSVEVFLPFEFKLCGQRYDSVFVSANGHVTFGAPDFQFAENIPEFLSGPARLAGLWRDLNTFNTNRDQPQGTVSFSATRRVVNFQWSRLPEAGGGGSNSMDITLFSAGGNFTIDSGNLSATNGLVGMSCGADVTSGFEQEVDLSEFLEDRRCGRGTGCLPVRKTAVFELFDRSDHDLDNTRLLGSSIRFRDRFERNDSIDEARRIRLPFSSVEESAFTEIRPAGDDVDYFRIRSLEAGQVLVAEALTGEIDTLFGLFNNAGELIALDDDGGAGRLSRLEFEIPADGNYFLAVGAWPDFDFTGAGNTDPAFGVGRYVLDVQTF